MHCPCPDLKERNTAVAQKWAELTDDERKAWSMKAEAMSDPTFVAQDDVTLDPQDLTPDQVNSALIESTLLRVQEKVHTHLRTNCIYVGIHSVG